MTPTRRLLDLNMNGGLDSFITEHRLNGRSWTAIARDLSALTGLEIADETLRRWYGG